MWNVKLVGAFNQDGITSPPISHYTRINNNNCETRHCSVVSVGCPLYSDTQLVDSWQLWRGRAGDALDSVRQDRHYARKVALVTSVMVVILPPIWKLLSLISFINLLFSLVISLKVRRERTQYPHSVPSVGTAAGVMLLPLSGQDPH